MQVSAGRVTPVLLKAVHSGGGRLRRTPQALQMTAVPLQEPPLTALAVKETFWGRGVHVPEISLSWERADGGAGSSDGKPSTEGRAVSFSGAEARACISRPVAQHTAV